MPELKKRNTMYLLFDIGATNTRLAVSKDLQSFQEPRIIPTDQSFDVAVKNMVATALELSKGEHILAAAGGIAGPLDKEKSKLVVAPNIPDWENKPLQKELEGAFNGPVFLENDTAIIGLGELADGAGTGSEIFSYITISTGLGGCRFVDGRIDRSAFGFEPGHHIIDADRTYMNGSNPEGHIEGFVSGAGFKKRFGKNPEEINDEQVWEEATHALGIALHNIILLWSPDTMVIGGSLTKKLEIEAIVKEVENTMVIFKELPEIKKAELGDIGGLHGAMAYLRQRIEL